MTSRMILRSMPSLATVTALGIFLIGTTAPSLAQSSAPTTSPTAAGMPAAEPSRAAVPASQPAPAEAAVEARIRQLHAQLKITPTEADQWNAVAQVMRDNEQKISDLIQQRNKSAGTMSAIDDLRSYEAITDAHADGLKNLIPAFQSLYDSMSDSQKKIADTVFSQRRNGATARAKPIASAKPANG